MKKIIYMLLAITGSNSFAMVGGVPYSLNDVDSPKISDIEEISPSYNFINNDNTILYGCVNSGATAAEYSYENGIIRCGYNFSARCGIPGDSPSWQVHNVASFDYKSQCSPGDAISIKSTSCRTVSISCVKNYTGSGQLATWKNFIDKNYGTHELGECAKDQQLSGLNARGWNDIGCMAKRGVITGTSHEVWNGQNIGAHSNQVDWLPGWNKAECAAGEIAVGLGSWSDGTTIKCAHAKFTTGTIVSKPTDGCSVKWFNNGDSAPVYPDNLNLVDFAPNAYKLYISKDEYIAGYASGNHKIQAALVCKMSNERFPL